ncbi:mitochondrial glycoprotein [Sparassis latifolia]
MSAIRALRQVSLSSSRLAVRGAPRTLCRAALAQRAAPLFSARAFSVTARAWGEGTTDATLSQKLTEELQYEKQAAEDNPQPRLVKELKEEGIWAIEDVAGNDEVALTRKFGNETIRLMFSIADIQGEEESQFTENQESQEEEAEEDEPQHAYPIRCSFSLTKSGVEGALTVDAMCQEGAFVVDNISFYSNTKVGTELTAEADWKRRGLYIGPQFDTLDVNVQEEFEKFLQERGINENLAYLVPEYAEFKEQKEYVHWLQNVKKFVDA